MNMTVRKLARNPEEPAVNVAIIGAGEVGSAYASAVTTTDADLHVGLCDPHPPQSAIDLAARLDVELHREPGEWLAQMDRIWLVVTGDLALRALGALLPHLKHRPELRHRALPSRVMAYFSIGMALYSEGSYEDVLSQLTDGLSWASGWQDSYTPPSITVSLIRSPSLRHSDAAK